MDHEKRVALARAGRRQTAQRSVDAAAIAEPVGRPHEQSIESFVPG
jgi:hypothetical protein